MDLQMAATPLYVTVAILMAIAAIISTEIRARESLLAKRGVNAVAVSLLAAAWISILQIGVAMLFKNNYEAMSKLAVFDLVAHTLVLVILLVIVCLWYRAIALYKETPAGMPTNPINRSPTEP